MHRSRFFARKVRHPMDFSGKVVLITGASRGIGRACAQRFADLGARVAVNFRSNDAAAQETVSSLTGTGHAAIRADIGDPELAEDLVEATIAHFGQLDILVNNAGIYALHPPLETTYADWQKAFQRTFQTNFFAAANLMHVAARHMAIRGGGRIVNVGSRGAYRGEPEGPAYAAAKAALHALGQSMAKALASDNIYVHSVAPGFVETDMARPHLEGERGADIVAQYPGGRVAQPEEVAEAVCWLASEGARMTTGTVLDLNGASYLR